MSELERRGAFYLGREWDKELGRTRDEPLLYDSSHLVTHAVCVGMTGSGKTGLGVTLLEEAALQGIPALVIDPKGDMGNLKLVLPALAPEDFAPWIDPAEAASAGLPVDEFAARVAERWREGLAEWGQDGARLERFVRAAAVDLYTPGSDVGRPLTVLASFAAPNPPLDAESLGERIEAAVAGLLALVGLDADPIQGREGVLLANLFAAAWNAGRDLSLVDLIREIQSPPFERLGVLDLESVFPAKDRSALALSLNNLLASPGFAPWLRGEPLDVARLLRGADGRPRIAVLSIAHLSERERMSFVTLLLGEVLAWMRSQPGTGQLRAILYMDEIFGYFPPVAEPPSKRPMLTLLKQARAHGLGVVLCTQNPVDLDYKGLANTGTWFLGRLQTERDKARVLDGLESAATGAGGFDRAEIDRLLSGLGKRVFLMNDVHERGPVLFQSRWAMSYLRGPLTREQIGRLARESKERVDSGDASSKVAAAAAAASGASEPAGVSGSGAARPVLPPGVAERFAVRAPGAAAAATYRAAISGLAHVHYELARAGVDRWVRLAVEAPFEDGAHSGGVDWARAVFRDGESTPAGTEADVPRDARLVAAPPAVSNARVWTRWGKELASHVYQGRPLVLHHCAEAKLWSHAGESEADFRQRAARALARERRAAAEALERRHAPKIARQEERVRKAAAKVDEQKDQMRRRRRESWMSWVTTLFGALFSILGGRRRSHRGSLSDARRVTRANEAAAKERRDVERARSELEAEREKLAVQRRELEGELARAREAPAGAEVGVERVLVRARKGDLSVERLELLWVPDEGRG